jgi:hypothetical protein
MKANITSFQVWDVISCPGFAQERIYVVEAVCHGAMNQDGGLELSPMDQSNGCDTEDKRTFFVPIEMLCAGINAGIFTHTPAPK